MLIYFYVHQIMKGPFVSCNNARGVYKINRDNLKVTSFEEIDIMKLFAIAYSNILRDNEYSFDLVLCEIINYDLPIYNSTIYTIPSSINYRSITLINCTILMRDFVKFSNYIHDITFNKCKFPKSKSFENMFNGNRELRCVNFIKCDLS